ncbi:MAG: hypothetical protein ACK5PP_08420, partial [Acidimicrobiales bacterium]
GAREERRSSGQPACTWRVRTGFEETTGHDAGDLIRTRDGVSSQLYRRACDGRVDYVWVPLVTAEDLLADLTDSVERQLPAPDPVIRPQNPQPGWVIVQVPLDFRTTPETWRTITATASVDGPSGMSPWVTITAVPKELIFASGDPADPGLVAGCVGDAAIAPYVAETPGACSYTYRNASTIVASDVFTVEVGITWDVTYTSSSGSGRLEMGPTITQVPLRVTEVKALVTCTGPHPNQGGC